ncbi:MAG: GTP cyclohydrolase II [Thermoplasmata archaeon]
MGLPKPIAEQILKENENHECPGNSDICVRVVAIAELPTRFGDYQVVAFWNKFDGKEHAAFIHGNVFDQEEVPVRLHSECLTGDAIGSLRCDCRDQLIESLERIGSMDNGIVLYLRQEGRGIGFSNKIRAYQLQDAGYDTVQANEILGFRPDERDYGVAAHMLGSLHVESIQILTNNPSKVADLQRHGVKIVRRVPVIVPPNRYNLPYLETKRKRMGHLFDIEQGDEFVADESPRTE